MSRDPYEDDRDRAEPRDAEWTAQQVARARGAVAAPAMFLILNGVFGLIIAAIFSVPMVFQPEMIVKFGRDMAAKQPPGQQRQDFEDQIDDVENQINQNRAAIQIQNAIELAIYAAANLLAIVGGLSMRGLGSYGLSMAGAIVSIIPLITGCCCTGTVFGIWALIALVRPDVKAAFAARHRATRFPDAY